MVEQCVPEYPLPDARLDQLLFLGGCERWVFDYLLFSQQVEAITHIGGEPVFAGDTERPGLKRGKAELRAKLLILVFQSRFEHRCGSDDRIDRAIGQTPVAGPIGGMSGEAIAGIADEARWGEGDPARRGIG